MSSPKPLSFPEVLGPHPPATHILGSQFGHTDGHSTANVPTRQLCDVAADTKAFVAAMRDWIKTHHSHPDDLARITAQREAFIRQGITPPTSLFPTAEMTRKGNWCEILLAEYILASSGSKLPVYRLRYNPNIEQSMKGDDVLAFDLDAKPVRIIVGEAKFRSTSTPKAVRDIVQALERSQTKGLPASLQFVATRLFREGHQALGERIEECSSLFVHGKLRLDHVGLLVSDADAHNKVSAHATSTTRQLAVVSLTLAAPSSLVDECFDKIDEP